MMRASQVAFSGSGLRTVISLMGAPPLRFIATRLFSGESVYVSGVNVRYMLSMIMESGNAYVAVALSLSGDDTAPMTCAVAGAATQEIISMSAVRNLYIKPVCLTSYWLSLSNIEIMRSSSCSSLNLMLILPLPFAEQVNCTGVWKNCVRCFLSWW